MQQILNFITTNYKLIISGVLLVISIITFILRKKSVNCIDTDIFRLVIQAVCLAEKGNLKGQAKLDSALLYVSTALKDIYPKLDVGRYYNYIVKVIEAILSTPQKK